MKEIRENNARDILCLHFKNHFKSLFRHHIDNKYINKNFMKTVGEINM